VYVHAIPTLTPYRIPEYPQFVFENLVLLGAELLLDLTAGLDALQNVLTVLVELQLGDDNL
jgi:hypothetical protein